VTDVFISYSRKDREQAAAIAALLTGRGYVVWWDHNLVAGSRFRDVIDAKLREARKVIVLWSSHSVASPFVVDEAQAAREDAKLIPVEIETVRPPLGFRDLHTIPMHQVDELPAPLLAALDGTPPVAGSSAEINRPKQRGRPIVIATLVLAALIVGFGAWRLWLAGPANYATFDSAELGFHLAFPNDLLSVDTTERSARRILLRDGTGAPVVTVSRQGLPAAAVDARAAQEAETSQLEGQNCLVTYKAPQSEANWSNWYVLSGLCDGDVFYVRRWLATDSIVTMEFRFPKPSQPLYEAVVPRMTSEFTFTPRQPSA
jgi:hypothetical protein